MPAGRNGTAIGSFEEPVILVVAIDAESTFVHESMMPGAKQHEVIEAGLSAG
jgi:hypothetical protein